MFSQQINSLQFVIYYDDIEVANPLGSRAGVHKLGWYNHMYNIMNIITVILLKFRPPHLENK